MINFSTKTRTFELIVERWYGVVEISKPTNVFSYKKSVKYGASYLP